MSDPGTAEEGVPRRLRFACACASAAEVADDPWTPVAKDGKLNDGTKELILNGVYGRPRTTAQLAQILGLSAPGVHRHVSELLTSELIREVEVPPEERGWSVERYYAPNFPVVLAADRQRFAPALDELAAAMAQAFLAQQAALADAFAGTSLAAQGAVLDDVLHYLYTTALRLARARLQADGLLPPPPAHRDGSQWLWWAEEAPAGEGR